MEACQLHGKPGRRWGASGTCYTFTAGDKTGRAAAEARAARQGRAVAAARAARGDAKKPPPRLFVQEYPQPLEDAYAARLLKRVTASRKLLDERLRPALKRASSDIDAAAKLSKRGNALQVVRHDQDSLEEITRRLLSVVRTTASAFTKAAGTGAATARQIALDLDRRAGAALARGIKRVHGISVTQSPDVSDDLIKAWTADNVALIKSIDARYFADVERVIADGLKTGRSTRQITGELAQRFQVSKSRARLIARDQLGTLNSKITQARQTGLGIEKYIWRNSGDDLVRDEHLSGPPGVADQVWTWAKGSPEGNPGEPIQCRCTADPVIEDPASLPGQVA